MKLLIIFLCIMLGACASNPSARSQVDEIKNFVVANAAFEMGEECPDRFIIKYRDSQQSRGWFPGTPLHGQIQLSVYCQPPSAHAYGFQCHKHMVHEIAHSCGVLSEAEADRLADMYWQRVTASESVRVCELEVCR